MGILKTLIVPSKTVEVEYPGLDGFKVSLAYLTRDELIELRKKATVKKMNRASRTVEDEVDSELFQKLYISAVIKDWSGLKYKYLESLLPIDTSKVSIENSESEVKFTAEDAQELMRTSRSFDDWVSSVVDDVANFSKSSSNE